jgi:hypothetical protein
MNKFKGTKPTKEFIQTAIFEDKRSLRDVSKEIGCDPNTLKHWAKEYGIIIPKFNTWTQRNAKRGYARPPKETLEVLYYDNNSLHSIGQFFGVTRQIISDAFNFYKIPVRNSGWGNKRIMCKDGHKVKSTYEQRVDDWLYENSFPHEYEPRLPFSNKGHSDFLCNNVYIEIFGVVDSEKYKKRMNYKIEQYKQNNIPVIIINFWDFDSNRNEAWKRKLHYLKSS